jgi:hypothetical protein
MASESPGQHYPWSVGGPSAESPALSSHLPPTPSRRRPLLGSSSSAPRMSPTAPRSMLRSIFATFSCSTSSTSARPDLQMVTYVPSSCLCTTRTNTGAPIPFLARLQTFSSFLAFLSTSFLTGYSATWDALCRYTSFFSGPTSPYLDRT